MSQFTCSGQNNTFYRYRIVLLVCVILSMLLIHYGTRLKLIHKRAQDIAYMGIHVRQLKKSIAGLEHQKTQNTPFIRKVLSQHATPWQGIAFTRRSGSWTTDDGICKGKEKYKELTLFRTSGKTPIFPHSINYDQNDLKNTDLGITYEALKGLRESVDHVFVDVGADIGVVSLAAALIGNRVVSIEPYTQSARRLCRGVMKGGFAGRMFAVTDALSNTRQKVVLKVDKKHVATVIQGKKSNDSPYNASSILLDDLLEIFNIKSCILKLDSEGMEGQVLKGAQEFFKKVDVRMVLVKWSTLRTSNQAPFVLSMMKRHKLTPYNLGAFDHPLNVDEYRDWTMRNVVFRRT